MVANEPVSNAVDEVAAAEAELKAAQDKLAAAKAKLAANSSEEGKAVDEVIAAAVVLDEETERAQAVIVEEAVVVEDAAPVASLEPVVAASAPEAANQEPVAADSASVSAPEVGWVPYSTAQTPPQNAAPSQAGTGYAQAPAPGYAQSGYPAPQTPPHVGPGAVPPQQPYYGYQQPYYQQPYAQPVVTTKDHVAAGLLAIFLGWLGIHKFYLGYNTAGFIMLGVSILGGILTFSLASWVIWVIAIIEGVLYLTKSQSEFEQMYVHNKREWF